MKKIGIIFFQLSFIILLLACTSANRSIWVDKNTVSFAWDPVTTTTDDPLSYSVYICDPPSKNKDAKPVQVEKCSNNSEVKDINNLPIACITEFAETSCIVKFNASGTFVLGVQSVDKKGNHSPIAWSDNKIYTNNNPFVVRVPGR
jgi:hypothetical protein